MLAHWVLRTPEQQVIVQNYHNERRSPDPEAISEEPLALRWSRMQVSEGIANASAAAQTRSRADTWPTNLGQPISVPAPMDTIPFVVIGIANTPKNTGHRSWIRATWMTLPNVGKSVHAVFLIGLLTTGATAHPPAMRRLLRDERERHPQELRAIPPALLTCG